MPSITCTRMRAISQHSGKCAYFCIVSVYIYMLQVTRCVVNI